MLINQRNLFFFKLDLYLYIAAEKIMFLPYLIDRQTGGGTDILNYRVASVLNISKVEDCFISKKHKDGNKMKRKGLWVIYMFY